MFREGESSTLTCFLLVQESAPQVSSLSHSRAFVLTQGYDVGEMPANEGELIQSVLQNKEAKFNSADLNIAYRMKVRAWE